ncbi:unnamed protein product [Fusarium graminearum]|uniref:Chromosome 1, complete genome n=2 Tax=Gibberella zeae TaxID=5518 RepID=A0A0E0RV29_GIBZE|nr:hypothetical protein FG05_30663 [Fusarium graminearum]CAF3438569.1 unnamed protein product [Fusarium graminearum]CAF3548469.1 unnamed protein product [Fusarium graminearum]CAG1972421.1 unnamed protein product [Fusarium graminearum]CAG2014608.1 unnamed protein product [Fusarium graminearum]
MRLTLSTETRQGFSQVRRPKIDNEFGLQDRRAIVDTIYQTGGSGRSLGIASRPLGLSNVQVMTGLSMCFAIGYGCARDVH